MTDDHRLLVDLWDEAFYWRGTSPHVNSLCERAFKRIKELEAMIETLEEKPMPEGICPSCGDWLDLPSGDGCANMTAHNNELYRLEHEPWEMLVTDVTDNDDGGTTISFDLDKEAHKAMANLGVQFALHCAAAQVDMQVALDAIFKMGEVDK